jgi:hypothetical protein
MSIIYIVHIWHGHCQAYPLSIQIFALIHIHIGNVHKIISSFIGEIWKALREEIARRYYIIDNDDNNNRMGSALRMDTNA